MKPAGFRLEIEQWQRLIGQFILAFAEIELITYRLWRDAFHTASPPRQFASRINPIIEHIRKRCPPNEELIALLLESRKLAKKRNVVAHNPVQIQVLKHTKTGELLFQDIIACRDGSLCIDDLELMELAGVAENLLGRLYISAGLVPQPLEGA